MSEPTHRPPVFVMPANADYTVPPAAHQDCFMCLATGQLQMPIIVVPEANAYLMPGSALVEIDGITKLVPIPFTALLVPLQHRKPRSYIDQGFPSTWESDREQLLPHIPHFSGEGYNISRNVGHAAGARVPKAVRLSSHGPHPFEWVVYGRKGIGEGSANINGLGLATIVNDARVKINALPDGVECNRLWETSQRQADPWRHFLELVGYWRDQV